ncbi:NAD(P)/FAD-dependent oxidoreductase [Rhodococcus jostii]|uniref:FAD-dependent oxidoreductase n=1 Tax=Rhodococcus jostii TaxID=132919 RepID=A0ABU4CSY5_RHOJO|nr:FAD-dependent oxidoreductase [Rhodococcus jostii]MDV6286674.1 FAD-dependent oxidoreductase [Rhodococcus jostii]
MNNANVVIVGAGHAGVQTAASLREMGHDGRILLIGDEPDRPYHRPPLSKSFIASPDADLDPLRSEEFFANNDIDLRLGVRARNLDPSTQRLDLDSGEKVHFDHLILALGSRNRTVPIEGAALDGVAGLRTAQDARSVRERLGNAQHVVVIGGGFIGMEFAAAAAAMGRTVTIFEAAPRTMARAVSPDTSAYLEGTHTAEGVSIQSGATVARIEGLGGAVSAVITGDDRHIPADLVLVGVGALPNTALAESAGIATGAQGSDGILVDDHLRTNHTAISAIGDCARFPAGPTFRRLESVQNAVDQARCVAARITGSPEPYQRVPWFWSHQGKVKLQIAGLAAGVDRSVVRGDLSSGRFSIFGYRGADLVTVESINKPGDHMAARRILESRGSLLPEQAANPEFSLKEVGPATTHSSAR